MVINLGLHGGRIGSIFITGIFGNCYTKRGGEFLTFKTKIPGGLDSIAFLHFHQEFSYFVLELSLLARGKYNRGACNLSRMVVINK